MKHQPWIAAAAVIGGLSTPALAEVVSFNEGVSSGNPIRTSYVSGSLTFSGQHFHIIGSPLGVANGTDYLASEGVGDLGQPVRFARTDGALFTLDSLEVAELWLEGNSNNDFRLVSFTGNQSGGGTLSLSFALDGIRDGLGGANDFQLVSFAGWTNLLSVDVAGIAAGATGDFALDNITINAGARVPEPSSWALMILGVGAVGGALRRRQTTRMAVRFA